MSYSTKLKARLERISRRFWGVQSVSDYRKFKIQRYRDNPYAEFIDNYETNT